jgi:hypothetical protein
MAGFGGILGGFGTGYGQYQNQQNTLANDQQMRQINQQKLQQMLAQMANDKATQQARNSALPQIAQMQGQGPGGAPTFQQIAGIPGMNYQAAADMYGTMRPQVQGGYVMQRTQDQQQGANDRNAASNDTRLQAVQQQQQGATDRNAASNQNRTQNVAAQQSGADARNKYSVDNRKSSATNATNLALLPEYRTAKTEYEEAKKDERNIEAHYPLVSQAYNDSQWLEARKRSVAAQAKMEAIQTKAAKAAPAAAPAGPAAAQPVTIANDDDYYKLAPGTPFIDPNGQLRTVPQPQAQ